MARNSTWPARPNIYGVYWRPSSDALIVTLRVQQPRGTERQVELVLDREHAADLASRILELVPVAAPVVPPAQLQTHVDDVGDVVCEHGTAVDVHCCNCHSGFIFDDQHTCEPELPDGAIGDLLAYGREESASALARKDRDSYQFWQGWNSALERAASVATEARQQQDTKEEDTATRGGKGVGC